MTNNDGSVIEVKGGGTLTLTDSAPGTMHYYSVDPDTKLWTILPDDTGAAGSIQGGIITGGSTGQGGVPDQDRRLADHEWRYDRGLSGQRARRRRERR